MANEKKIFNQKSFTQVLRPLSQPVSSFNLRNVWPLGAEEAGADSSFGTAWRPTQPPLVHTVVLHRLHQLVRHTDKKKTKTYMTLHPIPLIFLIYDENFILVFMSARWTVISSLFNAQRCGLCNLRNYWWQTQQSTYIPRVPQCLSPRPNWDSPSPLPPASVSPPSSGTKGGGTHSPAGEVVVGPSSNDWRNSRYLGHIYIFRLFLYCDFSREVNYQRSIFLISPTL